MENNYVSFKSINLDDSTYPIEILTLNIPEYSLENNTLDKLKYSLPDTNWYNSISKESNQPVNSLLQSKLNSAADYANAHKLSNTTHRCAHYVSNALIASGLNVTRRDGWNYGLSAAELGMHLIPFDKNATYKKGTIISTKKKGGSGHVAICVKDGAKPDDKTAWVSDFASRATPYKDSEISEVLVWSAKKGGSTPYVKVEFNKRTGYPLNTIPFLLDTTLKYDLPKTPEFKETEWYKKFETPKEFVPVYSQAPVTSENLPIAYSGDKNSFINMAMKAYTKLGLNKDLARVMVAQDAWESGWGKHVSGTHNYGGIKGSGSIKNTKEEINGKLVNTKSSFKNFESYDDYARYKVNMLRGGRYHAFDSQTASGVLDNIIKGGYATDSNYRKNINSILKMIK